LRDVQHLLGHVSISTTQVYRRLVGTAEPQLIVASAELSPVDDEFHPREATAVSSGAEA
jgi:site-specific recombinase XerD